MRPRDFTLTTSGPLRLYSTLELLGFPPPSYLIDGIIPRSGLVGLYGLPGAAKTFLALDLAVHVATGLPWLERPVEAGNVLYVAAEGGSGIGIRLMALMIKYGLSVEDLSRISWLMESVPIDADADEMAILLERIVEADIPHLSLIVIDTLARCFDGDEVKTEDMGRFIKGVDMLRQHFGCAVLIIHHPRVGGDRERGNGAFRGAAECMMVLEKEDNALVLTCNKMKDDADFDPIYLELEIVPITDEIDSCVIAPSTTVLTKETAMTKLVDTLKNGPLRWDPWLAATGMTKGSFQKAFSALKVEKKIEKTADGAWALVGP